MDSDFRPGRRARTALVLGVLSLAAPFVLSIPALVLALVVIRDTRRSPQRLRDARLAWMGLASSVLSLVLFPLTVNLLMPAARRLQEASARSASLSQLRDLGRALNHYAADHGGRFPPRVSRDPSSRPLLSWRVAILPYLGHDRLHRDFALDEPWDSEHNARLLGRMPRVFAHPWRHDAEAGHTYFLAPVAPGSIWDCLESDGLPTDPPPSRWLSALEADASVPWTKPDDWHLDPDRPTRGLGDAFRGGFVALFADGSVKFLRHDLANDAILSLVDPRP